MEGTHSVTVRLWDMPSGGTAACTTVSPTTPFVAGRFRVTMDATCAAAVQMNPNLWAEVIVDSTTLPRSRVGAVPYAIEASRAAGASGALATRIAAVEMAAQPRQVVVGTIGTSSDDCAGSYRPSSLAIPPLTVMASTTGRYRITTAVNYGGNGGVSGQFRIGVVPMVAFDARAEARTTCVYTSPNLCFYQGTVMAIARLQAGQSYTVTLDYQTGGTSGCTLTGVSPLVVEQLN